VIKESPIIVSPRRLLPALSILSAGALWLCLWLLLASLAPHPAMAQTDAPLPQPAPPLQPADDRWMGDVAGAEVAGAALIVSRTAGLLADKPPGISVATWCPSATSLAAAAGEAVVHCFLVRNIGSEALITHTLTDTLLGQLFRDVVQTIPPGAARFVTAAAPVTASGAATMTWSAAGSSGGATAAAGVAFFVPTIVLTQSVGSSPSCGEGIVLNSAAGAPVTFCFGVQNTGGLTLGLHSAASSLLGPLPVAPVLALGPGASAFFSSSAPISESVRHVITWTAIHVPRSIAAVASAAVTVHVPSIVARLELGAGVGPCSSSRAVTVTVGSRINYCLYVENQGGLPFEWHRVRLPELGVSYDFPYQLAPGATVGFTGTTVVTQSLTPHLHWEVTATGGLSATAGVTGQIIALTPADLRLAVLLTAANALRTSAIAPLAGISFSLTTPPGDLLQAKSGSDGAVHFPNLLPGDYWLDVVRSSLLPGDQIISPALPTTVTVAAGALQTVTVVVTGPAIRQVIYLPSVVK
jgi:hypothetical protein